jgi:FixJ family two-component response regulator
MTRNALVHIVDDDPAIRDALASLLEAAGLQTRSHASANLFFQSFDPSIPGCIVIDVCMPGMSGLALQEKLANTNIRIPVIILTGHADVAMAVEAMAKGAAGFLQKPPRSHELLDLVMTSVERHRTYLEEFDRHAHRAQLFERLTDREREILQLVIEGKPSKEIAELFGISQRTVEQHRSHLMRKLEVDSLAQLVRFAVESSDTQTPVARRWPAPLAARAPASPHHAVNTATEPVHAAL